MKMKKYISVFLALVLLCQALSACGASTQATAGAYKSEAAMDMVAEAPAAAPAEAANGALRGSTEEGGSSAIPENRKWIVTVNMHAETEDLDAMTAALDQQIADMKGYVENQNIYNGSNYASRRYRSADLTIRIPAENVDRFAENLGGIANIVRQSKSLEDITLQYVSTETRMTALRTEEARLLEFMEKAETMADLLEIEARLTDVRTELEMVTTQMKVYDNQINYATIYLSIEEVQEYTPVEEPTFLERITEGFKDTLEDLKDGTVDLIAWIIINSPYLVILALAILLLRLFKKKFGWKLPKRKKKPGKKVTPPEEQK